MLPRPDYNFAIGSGLHGWQTGQMLVQCEAVITAEKPDGVLVYGDTNSTLAGALAAAKLQVPVAHVEAGLRSFNKQMPEEHNRVLTDHAADLLFCPTENAVQLLKAEGIMKGVHFVGDVMFDAVKAQGEIARRRSTLCQKLELEGREFILATLHRPYNTDDPARLRIILEALHHLSLPVIFPIHPRTLGALEKFNISLPANVRGLNPIGYLDMLALEQRAKLIVTDSGGIQKEAYFFRVPCITVRPETEWRETVDAGWNRLAWDTVGQIVEAASRPWLSGVPNEVFGDGQAANRIVQLLKQRLEN